MTQRLLWAGLFASVAGCDINQSFLFPAPVEGVPGVQDLGTLEPVELTNIESARKAVIYGELGPTGSATIGGLTFNFNGVNGSVCVWVDPESIFWNQSISPSRPQPGYRQPDNVFDDGDLDVRAGNSAYYTGTPGERIDDFKIRYNDQLGNPVYVSFNDCVTESITNPGAEGHAGRGSPEYCTLSNTVEGVNYTVVMDTFSLPLDDDRLGYGLILAKGPCAGGGLGGGPPSLSSLFGSDSDTSAECVITGESLKPGSPQGERAAKKGLPSPTWLGDERPTWDGFLDFEASYCASDLDTYCKAERKSISTCSWEAQPGEGGTRCYCGDPTNNPVAGSDQ